jgi:hypothetical protein
VILSCDQKGESLASLLGWRQEFWIPRGEMIGGRMILVTRLRNEIQHCYGYIKTCANESSSGREVSY